MRAELTDYMPRLSGPTFLKVWATVESKAVVNSVFLFALYASGAVFTDQPWWALFLWVHGASLPVLAVNTLVEGYIKRRPINELQAGFREDSSIFTAILKHHLRTSLEGLTPRPPAFFTLLILGWVASPISILGIFGANLRRLVFRTPHHPLTHARALRGLPVADREEIVAAVSARREFLRRKAV